MKIMVIIRTIYRIVKKMKFNSIFKFIPLAALLFTLSAAQATLPVIMNQDDVLPYLEKMIAWHRQALSLEVSPALSREVLLKDSLQEHADKVLKSSFDFAHIVVSVAPPAAPKPVDPTANAATPAAQTPQQRGKNILNSINTVQQQIATLQTSLDAAKTPADRFQLKGKLELAEEHLTLLETIASNMDRSDEDTLDQQITKLAATIPELNKAPKTAAVAAAPVAAPVSGSGIFGLMTDLYGTFQARVNINTLMNGTKDIRDQTRVYSKAAGSGVKDILAQGDAIAPTALVAGAAKDTPTYDGLLADMKKLTKIAVASSGVGHALDDCSQDLADWKDLLTQHINELSSRIAFRIAALLVAIVGILIVSKLIGKAMPRYIPDERRLHQLNSIRKVTAAVAIGLIAFLGFFTDLSSLGTFIGLIGAGLAVALQNVILSVIAYFQFFGAFGLKPGDRITISGVTGTVMKIGMLRFYLMETRDSDLGYLPTGRAVGFSNAILFQPLPFFRQTPGTNFVWSEILLTLDPTVDHEIALKKIHAAVNKVYANHIKAMQQQQMSLQKLAHFKAEVSVPQIYLKITGGGLVVVIRYAVERDQGSILHLEMTEELLAVIKSDSALKIVNIG